MTGNLGFGGQYVLSVVTVWDVTAEDREVDYELRIPMENHPVFTWKGRWGGVIVVIYLRLLSLAGKIIWNGFFLTILLYFPCDLLRLVFS